MVAYFVDRSTYGPPQKPVIRSDPPAEPTPSIQVSVTGEDAKGVTSLEHGPQFLDGLKDELVREIRESVHRNARNGLKAQDVDKEFREANSTAGYLQRGQKKLVLVRLEAATWNAAFIVGIVGKEMKQVACFIPLSQQIDVVFGPCADKVSEVFGGRFAPADERNEYDEIIEKAQKENR